MFINTNQQAPQSVACLGARQGGQWLILLGTSLTVQHGVAVAEGAALYVLARQPHVHALLKQRAKGQRLAGGKVQLLACHDY